MSAAAACKSICIDECLLNAILQCAGRDYALAHWTREEKQTQTTRKKRNKNGSEHTLTGSEHPTIRTLEVHKLVAGFLFFSCFFLARCCYLVFVRRSAIFIVSRRRDERDLSEDASVCVLVPSVEAEWKKMKTKEFWNL